MNNRNRHMQYRRSIYRKRKIKAILISSVVAIIVIFALFMIVGSALHNKTKGSEEKKPSTTPPDTTEKVLAPARTVGAYSLPLLEDGSNFSDRLAAIPPNANAVCVNLNEEDGTLLFRPALSSKLSHISVHKDASTLSNYVTSIERNDFYISAALYIPTFNEEDQLLAEIEFSTWAAIACEVIQEGVGDILLLAPSLEAEDVERVCGIADKIRELSANAIVGFTLSDTILANEKKTSLVDTLSKHFNYLSLDTTQYRDGDDPIDYIEGRVSGLQLELMYYKMRVLLPRATEAETQQKYIDAITKYNITSWQILP